MKYSLVCSATGLLLAASFLACSSANAGWGHFRGGSSGGSAGYSSYGSSGYSASYGSSGYSASYGSSGYTASYGSSGSYAAYSSYGSSGGYAAYSSYGGSSGGSSGSPGILSRMSSRLHAHMDAKRARHAARRASYASYGSSGYSSYGSSGYTSYSSYGSSGYSSYSSYGSSGGYSASYGSSGGAVSYGSTGYSSGVGYGSTGVYYGVSNTATTAGSSVPTSLVSNLETSEDAVYLTVAVPDDARVFVNGNATTSTGVVRQFVSRGLKSGKSYRFQLRAEMDAVDGQVLTEEKELVVTAGEQKQVQFAFAGSDSPIETAVTINVPQGAKVSLAGNPTKATGETRTFRTSQLKPGQVWDDYEIEVKVGEQVKRQSIRLIAGDKLELTFNFDESSDRLASR